MGNLSNPTTIPTMTIGGRVFTDLTNLIMLNAYISVAATGYSTFRRGTSGYAVTTSKTYKPYAVKAYFQNGVAATTNLGLGYGDTDVGNSSGSGPTNEVKLYGSGTYMIVMPTEKMCEQALDGGRSIPASKYPHIWSGNGTVEAAVLLYGYEV